MACGRTRRPTRRGGGGLFCRRDSRAVRGERRGRASPSSRAASGPPSRSASQNSRASASVSTSGVKDPTASSMCELYHSCAAAISRVKRVSAGFRPARGPGPSDPEQRPQGAPAAAHGPGRARQAGVEWPQAEACVFPGARRRSGARGTAPGYERSPIKPAHSGQWSLGGRSMCACAPDGARALQS